MRWVVDDVKPTTTGSAGRHGYGFSIMDTVGMGPRLMLSLSYETEENAEKAHALISEAISTAVDIMR
jgi:hypothetical protein